MTLPLVTCSRPIIDFPIVDLPEPDSQDVRDIIAALAAEVGFDSFTDEPDGLVGYCQEDLFNKETLTEIIQSLPIPDVKVS